MHPFNNQTYFASQNQHSLYQQQQNVPQCYQPQQIYQTLPQRTSQKQQIQQKQSQIFSQPIQQQQQQKYYFSSQQQTVPNTIQYQQCQQPTTSQSQILYKTKFQVQPQFVPVTTNFISPNFQNMQYKQTPNKSSQKEETKEENLQPLKVMNLEDLKKHWEAFSKMYTANYEKMTYFCLMSLYYSMNMSEAENVLEVACGGAYSLRFLSQQRPYYQSWIATDISGAMLQVAYNRLKHFEEKPNSQIGQTQSYEELDFTQKDYKFDKFNVEFKFANNEDLHRFKENEFDRYISSCSLHLVENPTNQLKEAFRVLKPNGIAGFCVWGRRKNSSFFTLVSNILKQFGVKIPEDNQRSGFHIENKENLIKLAEEAGFINIHAWYQFQNMGPKPKMINLDECIGFEEDKQPLKDQIQKEILKQLNEIKAKHKPIGIEFMYIVCEKP